MSVIVIDPSGNKTVLVSDSDGDARPEIFHSQMIPDPAGNGAVMSEDEHTSVPLVLIVIGVHGGEGS
jgi:hypothetical protein